MFQCPNHPSRTGVLVEQGHVYVYIAVGVSDGLNIWSDTFAPVSNSAISGEIPAANVIPVN